MNNRLHNSSNPYQGGWKKVLCVCSAGLLRSPTTALVLSQPPYNFNTRAAGLDVDFALIPVDDILLSWADEIVCMTKDQIHTISSRVPEGKSIVCLDIEDAYMYRDPDLIIMIKARYPMEGT